MVPSDDPQTAQSETFMPDDPSAAPDELILLDWLKDRDAACPLCAYNIRGLTTPRCPECGQALRLSVSLAEPYLKAWIALIAGLLPPAGVGMIFIFSFCYVLMREGLGPFNFRDLSRMPLGPAFALLHVISCVPLSVVAILLRRRFLCWSRGLQRGCAVAAWAAILISSIAMLAQMR